MASLRFTPSEILTGEKNFRIWKQQVTICLKANELFSVANGDEQRPTLPAVNHESYADRLKAQQKYDHLDIQAQALLINSLDRNQAQLVVRCTTSREIFSTIINTHTDTSPLKKQLKLNEFCNFAMSEGMTAVEAFEQINEIAQQLEDLKIPKSKDEIILQVVHILDNERFGNFKNAWDSDSKQTLEHLKERLEKLDNLEKAEQKKKQSSNEPLAFASHQHNTRGRGMGRARDNGGWNRRDQQQQNQRDYGNHGNDGGSGRPHYSNNRGGGSRGGHGNNNHNSSSNTSRGGGGRGYHGNGSRNNIFQHSSNSNPNHSRSQVQCYSCLRFGHTQKYCRSNNGNGRNGNQSHGHGHSHGAGGTAHASRFAYDDIYEARPAFYGNNSKNPKDIFFADTGASHHNCNNATWFIKLEKLKEPISLNVQGEKPIMVYSTGTVAVECLVEGNWEEMILENTLYVPEGYNLFSIGQAETTGHFPEFHPGGCTFNYIEYDENNQVICRIPRYDAYKRGSVYVMNMRPIKHLHSFDAPRSLMTMTDVWHMRLGHAGLHSIKETIKAGCITGLSLSDLNEKFNCEACIFGKQARKPFKKDGESAPLQVGQELHFDTTKLRFRTLGGNRYFLLAKDKKSGYTISYFLKNKTQAADKIIECIAFYRNQMGDQYRVKRLRMDNGTELITPKLKTFCAINGIIIAPSAPKCPQQQGYIERSMRYIKELARAMCIDRNLTLAFIGEAIDTACYISNRLVHKITPDMTPFEHIFGYKPSVKNFKIFGCTAYANTYEHDLSEPKSRKCIFVGYQGVSPNYRLWDPVRHRIFVSHDVTFIEEFTRMMPIQITTCPMDYDDDDEEGEYENHEGNEENQNDNDNNAYEEIEDDDFEFEDDANHIPLTSSSTTSSSSGTASTAQNHKNDTTQNSSSSHEQKTSTEKEPEQASSSTSSTAAAAGATAAAQASSGTNAKMKKIQFTANGKQYEAEIPANKKVTVEMPYNLRKDPKKTEKFGFSNFSNDDWIFAMNSNLEEDPQSFRQAMASSKRDEWYRAMEDELKTLDEMETWEIVDRPVDKKVLPLKWVLKTKRGINNEIERLKARICCRGDKQIFGEHYTEIFAPTCKYESLRLLLAIAAHYKMVIRTADINSAFLFAEVDQEIFVGLPPGFEGGLEGKVYKLKRSLYGLHQSPRNFHMKLKAELKKYNFFPLSSDPSIFYNEKLHIFLACYVDDLCFIAKREDDINFAIAQLEEVFKLKRTKLDKFIGIEISQKTDGSIFLSNSTMIKNMLTKFNLENCTPAKTPMSTNLDIEPGEGEMKNIPFREIIGSLLFIARTTRSDILYATVKLSQFCNAYNEKHWALAKRILRYLSGTIHHGLTYLPGDGDLTLTAYSDADFGSCKITRKSVTAYCTFLNGSLISYKSQKQAVISTSSCESEIYALSETTKEVSWLRMFLEEIGFKQETPTIIFGDNTSSLAICKNAMTSGKSKHIHMRYLNTRDLVENGTIALKHVSTHENIADFFSKALDVQKFLYFKDKLGVGEHEQQMECTEATSFMSVMINEEIKLEGENENHDDDNTFSNSREINVKRETSSVGPTRILTCLWSRLFLSTEFGNSHKSTNIIMKNKKFTLFLMLMIIMTMTSTTIGFSGSNISPVVWRSSGKLSTSGWVQVNTRIEFVNPCNLINETQVHGDLLSTTKEKCNDLYNTVFMKSLEEFCPRKSTTTAWVDIQHRSKRLVPLVVVGGMALYSLVVGGMALSSTIVSSINGNNIRDLQQKLQIKDEQINQLQANSDQMNNRLQELRQKFNETISHVAKTELDFMELKEKSIVTAFLISYLTTRFMNGRTIFQEAKRQWRDKALYPPLLDHFGIILPCEENCPIKYAIPRSCEMNEKRELMYISFDIPLISNNTVIMDASPFTLMKRTDNETCNMRYIGPKNAVLNTEKNCIMATDIEMEHSSNVITFPDAECKNMNILHKTKYFDVDNCAPTVLNDEQNFIQQQRLDDQYLIYCPYSKITMDAITQDCPLSVFSIPYGMAYQINGISFGTTILQISKQENYDEILSMRSNWLLRTGNRTAWGQLYLKPDNSNITTSKWITNSLPPHSDNGYGIFTFIVTITILILLVLGMAGYLIRRKLIGNRTVIRAMEIPMDGRVNGGSDDSG